MIGKGFLTKAKKHRFAVHDGAYFPLFTGFPGGGTAFTLNVAPPPGNSNTGGSACLPVGGQNLQLALHHVKILTPGVPMLLNLHGCQVQHPLQRIIIVKLGLFFVICRNCRFRPLIIFVRYMILWISAIYPQTGPVISLPRPAWWQHRLSSGPKLPS